MKKRFKFVAIFIITFCLIIPAMFMLSACSITPAEIEFKVENGYIQYYDGSVWNNLFLVEDLKGEAGIDGREVEFQKTSTHIQWRYKTINNNDTWKNLAALTDLIGDNGKEVELRKTSTHIQWKYVEDSTWNNLVDLSELKGEKTEITIGNDGYWYIDGEKTDYKAVDDNASNITYTISYDYGDIKSIFKTEQDADTIKSTEWLTTLPQIKDDYKDVFVGWFITGTNKQIKQYDFVGGNITLQARFIENAFYYENCISFQYVEEYNGYKCVYNQAETNVVIPTLYNGDSGLKRVVACARGGVGPSALEKIMLPETLEKIENSAFAHSKLKSIKLPKNLKIIDTAAFNGCIQLETIEFPEGLQSIGSACFNQCVKLSSVSLPDSVIELSDSAFSNCISLSYVSLGKGITKISNGAFQNCKNLTGIYLHDDITEIGEYAFRKSGLISIIIPSGVAEIKSETFKECYSLKYVQAYWVETISDSAFEDSGLLYATLPNVKNIGNLAFKNCFDIKEFVLGSKVETIGENAFEDCANLLEVSIDSNSDIANSLTSENAFGGIFKYAEKVYVDYAWGLLMDDKLINPTYLLENFTKQTVSDKTGYDMYIRNL